MLTNTNSLPRAAKSACPSIILKPWTTIHRLASERKTAHMGPISTSLRSLTKLFARSTYSDTMSQVKQVTLCLAMVLPLLPTNAAAENVLKKAFVDWDYAVRVWQTLPTGEAFDREYERVNPAYEAWKQANGQPDVATLAALEGKDADLIRRGHDLSWVYEVWSDIYRTSWSGRGLTEPATPWNQTQAEYCGLIESMNIFTGQCNDLPDWRTDEDVARDDKKMANYLAKQAKQAATN